MDQGNQLEDCASRRNDKIKNHRLSSSQERLRLASMHLTHRKCLILITRSDNLHQGFIQMTSLVFLIMIPVRFHQTSQLAAMTQNLDGARGGGTLIRAELSRFHKKGACIRITLAPEVLINLSVLWSVNIYFYLSWQYSWHYLCSINWRWRCHVLGGILSQNMSQHLTTEMYAHRN